jgi:hypothetical protein
MVSAIFSLRGTGKDSTGEMSLAARQHGTIEQQRDPSAIRISVAEELKNRLVPPLEKLHEALEAFLAPAIDSPKYPDQQLDQEAT